MENLEAKRSDYADSLNQLLTTSCILAGFAVSGLIALPGIESDLAKKIASYFNGNFDTSFYYSFYAMFFSSICFLSTIVTILVYKGTNFLIPTKKLKHVHLIANTLFSFAIATLMMAVIIFGIPTTAGSIVAVVIGIGITGCFVWENMLPAQRKKREEQVSRELQRQKDVKGNEETA